MITDLAEVKLCHLFSFQHVRKDGNNFSKKLSLVEIMGRQNRHHYLT